MKRLSSEPFKSWFGYTRRERRSSLILLLIIFAVAGVRYLVPDREPDIKVIPLDFNYTEVKAGSTGNAGSADPAIKKPGYTANRPERSLLDINICDSASLVALPGIGPVLSARIIKYRKLLGGFASVRQLQEVYGLSPETYELISAMVKADSTAVKKINLNNAEFKQLIRMPYFDKAEVTAILKYRELKGRIEGANEMIENELIAEKKVRKILPYLEFN